jgi:hypothetical protein
VVRLEASIPFLDPERRGNIVALEPCDVFFCFNPVVRGNDIVVELVDPSVFLITAGRGVDDAVEPALVADSAGRDNNDPAKPENCPASESVTRGGDVAAVLDDFFTPDPAGRGGEAVSDADGPTLCNASRDPPGNNAAVFDTVGDVFISCDFACGCRDAVFALDDSPIPRNSVDGGTVLAREAAVFPCDPVGGGGGCCVAAIDASTGPFDFFRDWLTARLEGSLVLRDTLSGAGAYKLDSPNFLGGRICGGVPGRVGISAIPPVLLASTLLRLDAEFLKHIASRSSWLRPS